MRLKLFGVWKKPDVPKVNKGQKIQEEKEKVAIQEAPKENYSIISVETVPVEFYCELPPKVREQLVKNLAGGTDFYDSPTPPPRTLYTAI